jgi:hypothetical protein
MHDNPLNLKGQNRQTGRYDRDTEESFTSARHSLVAHAVVLPASSPPCVLVVMSTLGATVRCLRQAIPDLAASSSVKPSLPTCNSVPPGPVPSR